MSRAKTKSVAALLAFAAAFLLAALFCFGFPARRAHAEDTTASDALGLMNAVQNVADGDTITVTDDIDITADNAYDATNGIYISGKTLKIVGAEKDDGTRYTISTSALHHLISIEGGDDAVVTIENLKLVTTTAGEDSAAVRLYNGGLTVNLNNVEIDTTGAGTYDTAIDISGSEGSTAINLNIADSVITSSANGYNVMIYNPANITVENSSLTAWNMLYFHSAGDGDPSYIGSDNSSVKITGSTIVSNNTHTGGSNGFGAITLNADNITVNIENCDIEVSSSSSSAYQIFIFFWGENHKANISSSTIKISGQAAYLYNYVKGIDNSTNDYTLGAGVEITSVDSEDMATYADYLSDGIIVYETAGGAFKTNTVDAAKADGVAVIDGNVGYIEENAAAAGYVAAIDGTGYTGLAAAFAEATDGKTVKLLNDVYLTETIVVKEGSETIFDLNGKNITVQKNGERSLYAIDNYGTLTIMDSLGTGSITARGVKNLGNGVMTVNSGKIISCDTNGGASIWNEATLHVNGGTFETVHVGSPSDTYGAGCINNSGSALITGGTFNNVNRRTYAIISTTEMEITPAEGKEVIVFGAHGALSSDGGTLVVNGGNYSSSDYYGLYVSNDGFGADPIQAAVTVNDGTFDGASYSVWIGSDYNDPVNSTIVINDGKFKKPLNAQEVTREDAIVVFGGTFAEALPIEYLADGVAQMESNGSFVVDSAEELDGAVAMIEETGVAYTSLQDAINAAETDVTITLLADIGTNEVREGLIFKMEKAGVSVTLDLAGHSIYSSVDGAIQLINGTLTVKNGYILAMGDVFRIVPDQQEKVAKLVLEESLTAKSENYCAVFIEPTNKTDKDVFNAILVTSANLSTDGAFGAIQGNGSADGIDNRFGTSVTITGGRIESKDLAIYQPQYGELIITGGEIIGGTSAIEIRAGILKISGDATIVANGKELSCVSNGNGSTTNGVAVAVIQHTTGLALNASITGGTLKGLAALYQANPEQNDASEIENVSLEVENGTFNGQVYSENKSGFISGGFFDTLPESALFAEGFTPVDNDDDGVYEVMKGVVAMIGDAGYTSLQAAINAAETGETVTLLSDVKGNITVAQDKQITLDLNGKKIENDGSSHTVTNYGTLTVTGNGTVDNTANGRSALYNAPDASLTILSGTFVRSQEAGSLDGKSDGGNSYYVILNQGEMVIGTADDEAANEEILVYAGTSPEDSANHRHSSLISSGYFDTATYQEENAYPTLTIYGGTFYGGNGTVKNDELNTLTIAGGTFHAPDQALMNWSKATITGGEFNGSVIAWYYNGANLGEYDVSTDIQGGVFNNVVEDRNFSNGNAPRLEGISITNGTFASPVREEYLAEGYSFTLEDGNYVPANTAAVAEIDREGVVYPFAELAAALEAAQSGDTIRLRDNVDISEGMSIDHELTFDLCGHTLTNSEQDYVIWATADISIISTGGKGTIEAANGITFIGNDTPITVNVENIDINVTGGRAIQTSDIIGTFTNITVTAVLENATANNVATLFIDSTITIRDSVIDYTFNYDESQFATLNDAPIGESIEANGANLTLIGTTVYARGNGNSYGVISLGNSSTAEAESTSLSDYVSLDVIDSYIQARGFAISGNGLRHCTDISITGSTIISEEGAAIYHPQYGNLSILGSSNSITGSSGIEMRSGSLVVEGGTITATGDPFASDPNGNGSTTDGAAIAIVQHTTKLAIDVALNGGTYTGNRAIYEENLQNNTEEDIDKIALNVNGGTYNGELLTKDLSGYVRGGQFSELPADEAFADNYEGVEYNGYYVVIESTTDDTAALLAARANAQADVKAYAASLGVKWQEIVNAAADAESDNYKEAVLVVNMYDAIGSALSESAVAVARLNAMDAIEGYVSSAETALQTAKTDALSEIAEAAKATETQAEVVVPTATLLAINSAATVEEVNSYKENALKEIADIRAYRADIADQTAMLQALKDVIAGVDGEENSSLLDEIDALISQAQTAIVGTDDSVSLGSIYKDLGDKIDEVQSTLDTAVQDIKAELDTIDGFVDELESLLKDETNGLSAIRQAVADAKSAIDSAAAGTNLSALSQAITDAQNAITQAIGEVETELVSYNALLTGYNTQLQALSGKLGETAGASIAADIAALKQTIDSVNSSLGSLATGTDTDEIAAAIAGIKTTIDGIAAEVGQAAAVEEAKTNAVAEIASWLEGYLDEIIGGSASQNIVASMAVTLETEEGDLYAKIVSAFGEKNAPLVLKYYNEALTAIDNAESVSDVTMAVSTFKAQVASVEAAAGNTPALTGVYVLLAVVLVVLIAAAAAIIVLTLKKKPAAEAAAPVQEAPAQEAPAESAQEETPAAETAEEEAAQEETPAAEAQPAEASEEASDELAAADDDKDRIVIEANVRTFNEAYEELDEDKKALFNDVKEYALTKPQTRQVDLSSGICVKYGSKQVVKLVVRRGYPVALFLLENEMLKDFRRTTNSSAKLKIHATELVLREEADLAAAHRMVDLSLEQIAIDIENAKERRREARRARRKQKQAEAQADGESSDS